MYRTIFSVLLLSGVCAVAEAQSTDELERRFEEAERFYKVQKFQEALTIYEELYLKTGSPEFLYNIAQCYRLLGNYDKALLSYNSFLRDVPDTALRAQVEGLISEVKLKAAEPKPGPTSMATTTSTTLSDPVLVPVEGRSTSATPFFFAAGGVGAVWAVTGLLAIRAAGETKELLAQANATVEEFEARKRKARRLGMAADVSFVGAVALGSVGLVVRSKSRATVEVSATGLSFAMEF